jgi:phage recombination protein Bet
MARQQQQQQQPRRSGGSDMPPRAPTPADLSYPEIAAEYGIDKPVWNALRNLYPGAQDQSIVMVFEYCQARKLDPLKKPVHIVPMSIKDALSGNYMMRDVIMPGIQEMRTTAARTGEYAGMDPPVLGPTIEVPLIVGETTTSPQTLSVPAFVTTTVHRLVQGKRYPFTHTEYFAEAVARDRSGKVNEMWRKRPIGQCSKCSEAGALRKAFPEELGGEYAAEEMEGRDDAITVAAVEHGASGIPEPAALPAPDALPAGQETAAPEAVPAGEVAEVEVPTPEPVQAAAPAKPAAPAKAKPAPAAAEPAPAPEATGFVIDLPEGAKRVITAEMTKGGITEAQLLAKLGADLRLANINEALGLLKAWA